MKKTVIITLVAIITMSNLQAQSVERVNVKKVFGGYKYNVHGIDLKTIQLSEFIERDDAANSLMKKAAFNRAWSNILSGAGGLLIFPVGTFVAGKQPSLSVFGIGAALALASLPLRIASNRQAKVAVDTYNSNLSTSYQKHSPSLFLGMTKRGIGLSFKF